MIATRLIFMAVPTTYSFISDCRLIRTNTGIPRLLYNDLAQELSFTRTKPQVIHPLGQSANIDGLSYLHHVCELLHKNFPSK